MSQKLDYHRVSGLGSMLTNPSDCAHSSTLFHIAEGFTLVFAMAAQSVHVPYRAHSGTKLQYSPPAIL